MAHELVCNDVARKSGGSFEPPSGQPREFHRRLPGYAETPLVDVAGLAASLGVDHLWVKVESSRLGLPSFKMLGASWASYQAIASHFGGGPERWETIDDLAAWLRPHLPLSLAAATDGNHGRAVARTARLLGLGARIFVPAGTSQARIDAIRSEGASCEVVDGSYDETVARSAEEAGPSCLVVCDTSWPGYRDAPARVIEGYLTVFSEIDEQLAAMGAAPLDLVVVPIGVGGLAAAAVRSFRRPDLAGPPAILGVEPLSAACALESVRAGKIVSVPGPCDSIMVGLNCETPSEIAWPALSEGIDCFVAIEDDRAREAMRSLAGAGLVSGETGAAALAGLVEVLSTDSTGELRQYLGAGPASSVLVICTEGATDPVAYREIVGCDPEAVSPSR